MDAGASLDHLNEAAERREVERGAVTIAELGRRYGIGRTTAYELLAAGQLMGTRVGRRRLVTVASVERLLAAGLEAPLVGVGRGR